MATASPCSMAPRVAGDGLERVAERVAEVEERALAVFSLVARDDAGLEPRAAEHDRLEGVEVGGLDARGLALEHAKSSSPEEDRRLEHLARPQRQFALG